MSTRYFVRSADADAVAKLKLQLGVPSFVAQTLVARGIASPQAAREFLEPDLKRDWFNPYDVAGMDGVIDALERSVRQHRRIMVFGDFDLDGLSATAVMTRGLRTLGADVVPFVPRRSSEGYGISEAAIERCMGHAPDLLVTVDCGISCREEVKLLQHRGVEVVVTDHHEPAELVPEGVPTCDPKLRADSPCGILAGVGVALLCIQALGARFGQPHLWRELTDLATLGTVADLMPLVGANRALVADGVARMNDAPRPAIAALLAAAGAADRPVAANNLSFSVIPRLNAAGRMGDAQLALDLLLTDDFDRASELAAELEAVNDERRIIEAELAEMAGEQAVETYRDQRALVVAGEGWHEGVKGIVASRLVRTYGVPVLLFAIDEDGLAHGSGRSVGQVNLFKAVESCSDILTRFGGHEAAVGVTLPASDLPQFTERLCAYMDTLPAESFHPREDIDAIVDLSELTLENVEQLSLLAPFGQDNPSPTFLACNVMLAKARAVGAEGNHFSCELTNGRAHVPGILFHCSNMEALMQCECVVNVAFEVQIDQWRGRESVKAMIRSIEPAEPCAALADWLDPETTELFDGLYAMDADDGRLDDILEGDDAESSEADAGEIRSRWEERARSAPDALRSEVISAFIGDADLLPAQEEVLDLLAQGDSVLAVMATGRGKSLTFQVHAALQALKANEASLFVYPLRALISDQVFHLNEALAPFGIDVAVLTGETPLEVRERIYEGLAAGTVDIVATTPEFLSLHARRLAESGRIRFVVVDEAHHVGLAKAGNRPAYAALGSALAQLGGPVVLALTATASPQVAADIEDVLGTTRRVLDSTQRPNLAFDDQRNLAARDQYLASIIASGEKTVVYVNSRVSSVMLARTLRTYLPHLAPLIGFYNAGLTRRERRRVEDMFRRGTLVTLVSTSAFGEGVNIPDIRHVVLYHMPFNEVEFNQMSGRAGRDGAEACVHALFADGDAEINESILVDATPGHDTMAQVYREIRHQCAGGPVVANSAQLADACSARDAHHAVSAASVDCAVAVFRELGLVETRLAEGPGRRRSIALINDASRVELTDSVRYREGLDEIEVFRSFREWARTSTPDALRRRIIAPILPVEDDQGGQTLSL